VEFAPLAALARPVEEADAVDRGLLEVPVAQGHVGVHAGVQVGHAVEEALGRGARERHELEPLGPRDSGVPQPVERFLVHGVEFADAHGAFEGLLEALADREGRADAADRIVSRSGHGDPGRQGGAAVLGGSLLGVAQQGRADAVAALGGWTDRLKLARWVLSWSERASARRPRTRPSLTAIHCSRRLSSGLSTRLVKGRKGFQGRKPGLSCSSAAFMTDSQDCTCAWSEGSTGTMS
jgi:hypothetical protein